MLQQLIDQEIEGIKRKFDDQLQFIADPEKLRDELVDAEMRLESAIQTANMQIEGGFFAKLGKKYKADVQAKEKAEASIPKIRAQIEELKIRIHAVETEMERHVNKKRLAIATAKTNPSKVIENAIKRNLELCQNEEFMTECVAFNIKYAVLDKTDSDRVFKEFLRGYKTEYLHPANLGVNYPVEYINDLRSQIEEIEQEIENPKPVPDGSYKVPHKYLFDAMKKRFADMLDSQASILDAGAMYEAYVEYCKSCGVVSVEHGKQLERLYDAQDTYLYMHSIDYRGQNVEKLGLSLDGISEAICKEGLRLTTMGNEVGKLTYTTLNTKDDRWFSLINFIPYWSKSSGLVVLQIPKSKIDNGEPIIGSNISAELSASNPGYVLPEYVVGRIVDGAYQENPILETARARYKYTVSETGKGSGNKGYSM